MNSGVVLVVNMRRLTDLPGVSAEKKLIIFIFCTEKTLKLNILSPYKVGAANLLANGCFIHTSSRHKAAVRLIKTPVYVYLMNLKSNIHSAFNSTTS